MASANTCINFTFPLTKAQQRSVNIVEIFSLLSRQGVKSASFPWSNPSNQDQSRVVVRATAKALRTLAVELEVGLPIIQDLEHTILCGLKNHQPLHGQRVYPELRVLLDQVGRDGALPFGYGKDPHPDSYYADCAAEPRQQLVALRFQRFVLARVYGKDQCAAFLTDSAAIQVAEKLVNDAHAAVEERRVARAVAIVASPHARFRPAAIAS